MSKITPGWNSATQEYLDHMIGEGPDCLRCVHYLKENTCKAFPKGIPEEINFGKNHIKPYEGDNGFQFEEKK